MPCPERPAPCTLHTHTMPCHARNNPMDHAMRKMDYAMPCHAMWKFAHAMPCPAILTPGPCHAMPCKRASKLCGLRAHAMPCHASYSPTATPCHAMPDYAHAMPCHANQRLRNGMPCNTMPCLTQPTLLLLLLLLLCPHHIPAWMVLGQPGRRSRLKGPSKGHRTHRDVTPPRRIALFRGGQSW